MLCIKELESSTEFSEIFVRCFIIFGTICNKISKYLYINLVIVSKHFLWEQGIHIFESDNILTPCSIDVRITLCAINTKTFVVLYATLNMFDLIVLLLHTK